VIQIFHNILWSKYKGVVFSELHTLGKDNRIAIGFTQIAESDSDRIGLADVDLSYHQYPYKLLFKGAYSAVPKYNLIKTLFLEVWNSQDDIVLLPGFHTLEFWGMLLAGRLRNKIIGVFCDSTAYDRPKSFVKELFKKIFFSRCDIFFCYGQRSRDYLKHHNAPEDRIFFRFQAAALPHDYDKSTVISQRIALANKHAIPRFIYVGRLSYEKGLDTLLHAFKVVLIRYPNSHLVLIGTGPIKTELGSLSDQLNISSSVEFAGSKDINGLCNEYLMANCLVLPSTSEPWGLVVNEALAYGCPVVVSHNCGCVPELVVDGVSGYEFKTGDVDDLADKMQLVLKTFTDVETSARNCLAVIAPYTAVTSARQILDGCEITIARLKNNG
jgi:glycosyltransferase involved in cell wall biosynthesis